MPDDEETSFCFFFLRAAFDDALALGASSD